MCVWAVEPTPTANIVIPAALLGVSVCCVCVCVCVCERERERDNAPSVVCVCVCVCERARNYAPSSISRRKHIIGRVTVGEHNLTNV